jgi:hypothetical protein
MRIDDDPRQDLEHFEDEEIIDKKIQEKLEKFPDNRYYPSVCSARVMSHTHTHGTHDTRHTHTQVVSSTPALQVRAALGDVRSQLLVSVGHQLFHGPVGGTY